DREHDVVGGEGRAVVELHVGPELEAHRGGVDGLPREREAGLDLQVLAARGERLVHVVEVRVGEALVVRVRVERGDVALARVTQGLGFGPGNPGEKQDERGGARGGCDAHDGLLGIGATLYAVRTPGKSIWGYSMTEEVFREDAYRREVEAKVTAV